MDKFRLHAAATRMVTTPPLGMYLIGYGDRSGGSQSTHDDLTATALVLDDGHTQAVLIGLDILGLNWEIVSRVKTGIETVTGIPGDHVLICCSHTHSGPIGYAYPDRKLAYFMRGLRNRLMLISAGSQPRGWNFNQRYIDWLVEQLVLITRKAKDELAIAELSWGLGESYIGHNRRERTPEGVVIGHNPDGPIDRAVTVLCVTQKEKRVAMLVNFACHATIMGPNSYAVSSDWVGAMRDYVESHSDGLCIFMQGACGDINPHMEWSDNDWPAVERKGTNVGVEVIRICENLIPISGTPIDWRQDIVWAQLDTPEVGQDGSVPNYQSQLHTISKTSPEIPIFPKPLIDPLLETRYPWKTVIERRDGLYYTPIEINALRFGDVAMAAISMEPFTETGLAVKAASPALVTLFAGYSNGLTGYLPTANEHTLGGYEVELGPYFYRLPGILASETETQTVQALNDLIEDMFV